ncbi:MAG: EutN/CcmL family microcompartment protein [Pseudomonadales bacterium]
MLAGKVVDRVWSAKKLDQLPAGALLEIELEGKGGTIVALDPLGCGEGERVLVTTGPVASNYFSGDDTLVDALVIASLAEPEKSERRKAKK